MKITKQGFKVSYQLLEMEYIKPGGVFKADNGTTYPASVKLRSSILSEVEDEILGIKDDEVTLEYKILCDSDIEAGNVNRLLRQLKENGVVVTLTGAIPKPKSEFNPYPSVIVVETGKDILSKYHNQKDKKVS